MNGSERFRGFVRSELVLALLIGVCAHLPIILAQCSVGWSPEDYALVDEFGYSRSAILLESTGRLDFLGWASMTLFGLLHWARPFLAWFGLNFLSTRIAGWSLDVLGPAAIYLILRQRGATRFMSVSGALAFGWSPLYTMAAAPFMTDAPYLALCLVGVLCFERALSDPGALSLRWLSAGALAFVAAGSIRQTAVLGLVAVMGAAGRPRLRAATLAVLAAAGLLIAAAYGIARTTPGFLPLGEPLPFRLARLLEWPSVALVVAMGLAPLAVRLPRRRLLRTGLAFTGLCLGWALAARATPGRPPGFAGTALGPGVADPVVGLPLIASGLLVLVVLPSLSPVRALWPAGVLGWFAGLHAVALIPLFLSRPLFDRYALPVAAALTVAAALRPGMERTRVAVAVAGMGVLSTLMLESSLHDKILQWELGRSAAARAIPPDAVAIDFTWAGFHAAPGSLWDATQNAGPRPYRVTPQAGAGKQILDRRDRARWWRPGARGGSRYFYLVAEPGTP